MEGNTIAGKLPKQNVLLKIVSFSWVKRSMVVEVICILFILLFMYAAVSKLIDYKKFTVQLGQSPLLTTFSGWIAWIIPAIEIIISLMLFTNRFRMIALYASFNLMTMFSTYIFVITHFTEYVPCSCGGILEKMTWNQHLIFNVAFILLACYAIIAHSKEKNI